MKKYVLIMLLVLFLSVSMTVTAENLDGFTNSQETILTQTIVEIQAVTAQDFGGVVVLSVSLSEQIIVENNTIMPDIGLEMEIIAGSYNNFDFAQLTIISELRGDYLHYADIG